jgi:hypothetical protein
LEQVVGLQLAQVIITQRQFDLMVGYLHGAETLLVNWGKEIKQTVPAQYN